MQTLSASAISLFGGVISSTTKAPPASLSLFLQSLSLLLPKYTINFPEVAVKTEEWGDAKEPDFFSPHN